MSIRLMTEAWKSTMPSGRKMVLLALCDNANDQGECYPSISMLAEKCSMSERSVFSHVFDLEKMGAVVRQNRLGRSTIYHIDPCKFCTPANIAPLQPLQDTPANIAPPPLQNLHPTPAKFAPITINEPSIEPSSNHKSKTAADKKSQGVGKPDDIDAGLWSDFLVIRKSKGADTLTSTAFAAITREAEKAGVSISEALATCCEENWRGFKADWYANLAANKTLDNAKNSGIKRGSDEYAKLHKTASWWANAGFDNVWNAMSAGCYHDTANRFADGKKQAVPA